MTNIQVQLLSYIQHIQSVEVNFAYADLPNAFSRLVLPLPVDQGGLPLSGDEMISALAAQAPSREWFERQELHLTGGVVTALNLPPELQAVAPIRPLSAPLAWYEDARVGEPAVVDGQWVRPSVRVDLRDAGDLPQLKVRLLSRLADVRYQRETGGVNVGGALVKTDRESQATITGAYARALSDPGVTVAWKADNGFVTLDSAAILLFGAAVFNHVQACFAQEMVHAAAIDAAANVAALLAVDVEAGWPGQEV